MFYTDGFAGVGGFFDRFAERERFPARAPRLHVAVLDLIQKYLVGIGAGATPFCGVSEAKSHGAIYYGLKDPAAELGPLFAEALRKLKAEARCYSEALDSPIVRMLGVTPDLLPNSRYDVDYAGIRVSLPSRFCAGEKNRIRLTLSLYGIFEVAPRQNGAK